MPPRYAFVGADPDAAVARLKQRADEVVYQSGALFILHSLPVPDTERSLAFGADPQRARPFAHHVAHAHAGKRRRHQLGVVSPRIDAEIRIGSIGQWECIHRRAAQAQKPRLHAHPDVPFVVFEQRQHRAAGRHIRRGDGREPAAGVLR